MRRKDQHKTIRCPDPDDGPGPSNFTASTPTQKSDLYGEDELLMLEEEIIQTVEIGGDEPTNSTNSPQIGVEQASTSERFNHTESEKHRRSHLKDCMEQLRKVVPDGSGISTISKHTTHGLLKRSKKLIQVLEVNEKTCIASKEKLLKEREILKMRLQTVLSSETSGAEQPDKQRGDEVSLHHFCQYCEEFPTMFEGKGRGSVLETNQTLINGGGSSANVANQNIISPSSPITVLREVYVPPELEYARLLTAKLFEI